MIPATLTRLYNLVVEQYARLLGAQREKCAVCCKRFSRTRPPVVDHDHLSGLVRGLLCGPCNYELGLRHDDAEWFRRAADYLENPPAVAVIGRVYVPNSPGAAGFID